MAKIASFHETGPRYPTLRVIGLLCTLVGVILLAIGGWLLGSSLHALATVGNAAAPPPFNPAQFPDLPASTVPLPLRFGSPFVLLWSLAVLSAGVQLIAVGAFFRLMIHLEENTRVSAQVLDKLRSRLEAGPEGGGPLFRA